MPTSCVFRSHANLRLTFANQDTLLAIGNQTSVEGALQVQLQSHLLMILMKS